MSKCTNFREHFENIIIFGACGKCEKVWGLGTEPENLEEALKHTEI